MNKFKKQDSRTLAWAEHFARLMDSQYRLPGTGFKFGLDPVIGLIPGLGDAVTLVMQSLLVFTLIRKGYSGELLAKMLVNVLIDTIIGAIPVVGQITDFFFKASQRNLRLTREYLYENKHQGSGRGIWIAVVLVCLLTIFLLIYGIVALITWLISLF